MVVINCPKKDGDILINAIIICIKTPCNNLSTPSHRYRWMEGNTNQPSAAPPPRKRIDKQQQSVWEDGGRVIRPVIAPAIYHYSSHILIDTRSLALLHPRPSRDNDGTATGNTELRDDLQLVIERRDSVQTLSLL